MEYIFQTFPVTNEEYAKLDSMFGDLAQYAAWQLIKKNAKNNHTHEQEDVAQDLRMAIVQAASYYKRQVYLEECFRVLKIYSKKDDSLKLVVDELIDLWENRTRHGANRQKFGIAQEYMLDNLIKQFVPVLYRPNRNAPLRIDTKFKTYCKAITWNRQKSIGKKITREKMLRSGMVSLSEYDYLVSN